MKYIKKVSEAHYPSFDGHDYRGGHSKELEEKRENIADVLVWYYANFSDELCNQIAEIVWSVCNDDSAFVTTDVLSKEDIYNLVDSYQSKFTYYQKDLLDLYQRCLYFYNSQDDSLSYIKEVFLEYSDFGKVFYNRKGEDYYDTYEVTIRGDKIFSEIDFMEIFGRLGEIGYKNFKIQGEKLDKNSYIKISFAKTY